MTTNPPTAGDTHVVERTSSLEEVKRFADLSGDRQAIHTDPDENDRVVVHGLLTATLRTRIGGDLAVLAGEMGFSFERPVYTGERVVCEWTNEAVEERADRYELVVDVECTFDGETVVTGDIEGVVWKDGRKDRRRRGHNP